MPEPTLLFTIKCLPSAMAPPHVTERSTSVASDVDEKQKIDIHNEQIAVAKLTEEDIFRLSEESLQFRGRAAWKVTMIMFVMGCNQAGKFVFLLRPD